VPRRRRRARAPRSLRARLRLFAAPQQRRVGGEELSLAAGLRLERGAQRVHLRAQRVIHAAARERRGVHGAERGVSLGDRAPPRGASPRGVGRRVRGRTRRAGLAAVARGRRRARSREYPPEASLGSAGLTRPALGGFARARLLRLAPRPVPPRNLLFASRRVDVDARGGFLLFPRSVPPGPKNAGTRDALPLRCDPPVHSRYVVLRAPRVVVPLVFARRSRFFRASRDGRETVPKLPRSRRVSVGALGVLGVRRRHLRVDHVRERRLPVRAHLRLARGRRLEAPAQRRGEGVQRRRRSLGRGGFPVLEVRRQRRRVALLPLRARRVRALPHLVVREGLAAARADRATDLRCLGGDARAQPSRALGNLRARHGALRRAQPRPRAHVHAAGGFVARGQARGRHGSPGCEHHLP